MSRKLFIVSTCVLVILLQACNKSEKNRFTIRGTYSHANMLHAIADGGIKDQTSQAATKVYLQEIVFGRDQPPVSLDSITLKGNSGSFSLNGAGKPGGIYELIFGNNAVPVPFIYDTSEIIVNVDLGRRDDYYTVSGSAASVQLKDLIGAFGKKSYQIDRATVVLDSLQRAGSTDTAMMAEASATRMASVAGLNQYLNGFISTTTNPSLGVLALSWGAQSFGKSEFENALNSLQSRYPNNQVLVNMKRSYDAQVAAQPQTAAAANSWVGKVAPELVLPDVHGKPVSLSAFRGKYLLVDFWASWCGPCRNENPNVVKAFETFKNKNFTILGVSLDKDKDAWQQAIATDHLNWSHVSDLKYWSSKAVDVFKFEGIPFNILLDPEGKVIAQELRGGALLDKLGELLK